jgi:hypothetical protein
MPSPATTRPTLRTGLLGLLALCALALACAGAAPPFRGTGTVWRVDPLADTIAIDDHVYRVTPETRLLDRHGERIPLHRIPTAEKSSLGDGQVDLPRARYEAVPDADALSLRTLRVVEPG